MQSRAWKQPCGLLRARYSHHGARKASTIPPWRHGIAEPFSAFPSWFLRIECDACGKAQMVNESHVPWRNRRLGDILKRMRHDGCGGLAAKAELLTGVEAASSRPVRKIVLLGGAGMGVKAHR